LALPDAVNTYFILICFYSLLVFFSNGDSGETNINLMQEKVLKEIIRNLTSLCNYRPHRMLNYDHIRYSTSQCLNQFHSTNLHSTYCVKIDQNVFHSSSEWRRGCP